MMANEQMGFEDLMDIGQDTGTGSYVSVVVADRASGMLIPGAAVAVTYAGNTYGANAAPGTGKALVLTGAPPGSSLVATITYPGYNPAVVPVSSSSDSNVYPTPVVMDKAGVGVPFAMPGAKVPVGGKALTATTAMPQIPNWWIYAGLGALGLIGVIVIIAINKK